MRRPCRQRDESAPRGNPELAVDAAGVGAHRLDADVQRKGDLRVGATLPEEEQHLGLALGQQRVPEMRMASVVGAKRHDLQVA